MGKKRGEQGQSVSEGGSSGSRRTTIIIAAIVVAFLGGFLALVIVDSRQRSSGGAPDGVQKVDVGSSRQHQEGNIDYPQSPPAGGKHNPVWQNAGFYAQPVGDENATHTLEHGAVWITYSPDLPQAQKDTIQKAVEGRDCVLASPYPDLPSPVVVSAWGNQLRLDKADDPRLEQFVGAYRKGPQTPEPGAPCTGGTSETL